MSSLHIFTIADPPQPIPAPDFVVRTHYVVPWDTASQRTMKDPDTLRAMLHLVNAVAAKGAMVYHFDLPVVKAINHCHELSAPQNPYTKRDGGPYAMLIADGFYTVLGLQKYLAPYCLSKCSARWDTARRLAEQLSELKRHL